VVNQEAMDSPAFVEFCEAIAWKLFGGYLPQNISPELLAIAVLEASPPFHGASTEVKKYVLLGLVPLICSRQVMQMDVVDADGNAEWKSR
jgi:hypothetical protein